MFDYLRRNKHNLFLVFLLSLICFLFGVQYGYSVRKYDDYFKVLLEFDKSEKASEVKMPLPGFFIYNFKSCDMSFVLPEGEKSEVKDTHLISFWEKERILEISCFDKEPKDKFSGKEELIFLDKKIKVEQKGNFFFFIYKHPEKQLWYKIEIKRDLYPLFSRSIRFL